MPKKDDILARLDEQEVYQIYHRLGVQEFGSGGPGNWLVRTPWREDHNPSLNIHKLDGVWKDMARPDKKGSIFDAVIKARGGSFTDALEFVAEIIGIQANDQKPAEKIVKVYDYRDAEGRLQFQVVRFEPKHFSQRRPPTVSRDWIWSLKGVRRLLYRLPELAQADQSRTVLIVEGEKDADRLAAAGFLATTAPQGAGKWKQVDARSLHGRHVVIIPDNDIPGWEHAEEIARSLYGKSATIRVVELPGLGERREKHGLDVSDWFDQGHTADELKALARDTPPWEPNEEADTTDAIADEQGREAVITSLANVEPEPVEWLWKRWLPKGKLVLLSGLGEVGKSTLCALVASTLSTGGAWPDGTPAPKAKTLFLLAEDDLADTLRPRLDRQSADVTMIDHLDVVKEPSKDGKRAAMFNLAKHLPLLERAIAHGGYELIVIDPLTAFLQGVKVNDEIAVRDALMPLVEMAQRTGVTIIGLMHLGKPSAAQRTILQMFLGASAFGNIARIAWAMIMDPDDPDERRRILQVTKSNLAMKPKPLVLTIAGENAPMTAEGESEHRIEELLKPEKPEGHKLSPERQRILDYLAGKGPTSIATAPELAEVLGKREGTVRKLLMSMADAGQLERFATGVYRLPAEDDQKSESNQSPGNGGITSNSGNNGNSGNAQPLITILGNNSSSNTGVTGVTDITMLPLIPPVTADSSAPPGSPCQRCRSTGWYRRADGRWLCGRCHPAPTEEVGRG